MSYAKVATLMVVGRLCNGTLVARKWDFGFSWWRLDLGVPPPRKSEPYTHFLGNYGSCDVTMLTSKRGYLIGSTTAFLIL